MKKVPEIIDVQDWVLNEPDDMTVPELIRMLQEAYDAIPEHRKATARVRVYGWDEWGIEITSRHKRTEDEVAQAVIEERAGLASNVEKAERRVARIKEDGDVRLLPTAESQMRRAKFELKRFDELNGSAQ